MSPHTDSAPRRYVIVGIVLLGLLGATFGLAHVDLGRFSVPVALAIAVVKALLVALYFMHLRRSSGLLRVMAVAGVFWLGILVTLTMTDYVSRNWLSLPSTWPQPILDTVQRGTQGVGAR